MTYTIRFNHLLPPLPASVVGFNFSVGCAIRRYKMKSKTFALGTNLTELHTSKIKRERQDKCDLKKNDSTVKINLNENLYILSTVFINGVEESYHSLS